MHGFGIGASIRRGGHLHHEAMNLRRHGVRAYAPNVSHYNTVPARAEMWMQRIERVMEETRAERLTLIAHSMGGLDARYLITKMGLHEHVGALVTVATPHHGTPVASLMLDQPSLVLDKVAELADWIGSYILEDGTSNSLQTVSELTPEYMTGIFNPDVPDHPSVAYWSYGGRAGKGTNVTIDPFLRLFNAHIYKHEGDNDGLVSVASARWGRYLGAIDADHPSQVGINTGLNSFFDSNRFYRTIVQRLADAGF